MLADQLALAINFENGGNSASGQVGHYEKTIFSYPYCDGLQIELFR